MQVRDPNNSPFPTGESSQIYTVWDDVPNYRRISLIVCVIVQRFNGTPPDSCFLDDVVLLVGSLLASVIVTDEIARLLFRSLYKDEHQS